MLRKQPGFLRSTSGFVSRTVRPGVRLGLLFGSLLIACSLAGPGAVWGHGGAANGNVAIVDTPVKAYGYSGHTQTWTEIDLDSPALVRASSEHLGYVRTLTQIHSFHSNNQRWNSSQITGVPLGESTRGATSVCWTTNAGYATASLWTVWKPVSWPDGEEPIDGGSCGNFALVWTKHHAYAFHSASGTWTPQAMAEPISGGITCDGFGLVWTPEAVYSFDPTPGIWISRELGGSTGVSVTGGGSVALAWSPTSAEAYSGILDAWYSLPDAQGVVAGVAQGNLALLWSEDTAWVFDANTGLWQSVALEGGAGGDHPPKDPPEVTRWLRAGPNPAAGRRVELSLPGDEAWEVAVFDVAGRCVRRFQSPACAGTARLVWDGADEDGRPVAAGTYWIRAHAAESIEARRIVLTN